MPTKKKLPEELTDDLLVELYEEYGWSVRKIADHYNKSRKKTSRELKELGVEMNEPNKAPTGGYAGLLWQSEPDEVGLNG